MILPLWTSVTEGNFRSSAYSMAERTSRCDPSFETGFTPNDELSGKRTFVTPICSVRNFRNFSASGVPAIHSMPA